jgi:selenocysteine lyase/cysteine desulfurase
MKSDSRRSFISKIVVAGAIPWFPSHLLPGADASSLVSYKNRALAFGSSLINDEQFWYQVKTMYSSSPGLLNLNNGGVSPQPLIVQEAHERYNKMCNEAPSYYMWRVLDQGREPLRQRLADLAGTSSEEIAVCRNASEALETCIFGIRLQRGDAVVLSRLDYPNMIHAWKQREHRDGIILKWVDLEFPRMTEDEVVQAFREQISGDVKVVHITHMINWNGHILPVRRISDIAHAHGARTVVDGAHTFGHIQFSIPDLGADYFGTSLHKWLCAPFGSGMLYVKQDHIGSLYPLFAHSDPELNDIRKFESLGTRSFAIEQAIGQAIDFHLSIGGQLKQERLQFLKTYWTDAVRDHPKIRINTDTHPSKSCALCIVDLDGLSPAALSEALHNKYKIHTTAIDFHNVKGVRVTPHVYIVKSDLDRLIDALHALANT